MALLITGKVRKDYITICRAENRAMTESMGNQPLMVVTNLYL